MPVRPMFPLGSVLLPGMVLPLHIFEERYRALVRDCLAADREFGVALIERGSEVGGGDIRAMAGTIAEIIQADEMPDGRWAMVAVGTRRIKVQGWLPDDPYPIAEVEDWLDGPPTDPLDARAAYVDRIDQLRRVLTLAVQLGVDVSPDVDLSADPTEGSYQIATLGPFGALDRQRLLTTPTVDERLAMLEELLDDQELMIRARLDDR
jgi:Lon protease-like protein